MEYTGKDIANYVLALSWDCAKDEDEDIATSDVTQMKLHKLLYFIQGFALALLNRRAFSDPIVAWEHGPVVEEVYHAFKGHGKDVLPKPAEEDVPDLEDELADVIDEVMEVYGQFSAWKLRTLTHTEGPWRETTPGQEIALNKLSQHFKGRLKAQSA